MKSFRASGPPPAARERVVRDACCRRFWSFCCERDEIRPNRRVGAAGVAMRERGREKVAREGATWNASVEAEAARTAAKAADGNLMMFMIDLSYVSFVFRWR